MNTVFFVIGIILFSLAVINHILPLFLSSRKCIAYIGIVLHSLMLVSMILASADIKLVLLLYMASVAVYSIVAWLIARREKDDV